MNRMKTLRKILAFPLEIMLFGVVLMGMLVSLMGEAIGALCRVIEESNS